MEERLTVGMIVKHFKRDLCTPQELDECPTKYLYRIIDIACHTETGELLVIYLPLYETDCLKGAKLAARPLDMFMSEVDRNKYPDAKQQYRFEQFPKTVQECEFLI